MGDLPVALEGADVFIGASAANVLKPEWVELMGADPIVFALANPDPEIAYDTARKTKIAVLGTGRSDYPNQINNVLAFPGIFHAVLKIGAPMITEDMKLAAAHAIAALVSSKKLSPEYVIPSPLDARVASAVSRAVMRTWKKPRV
jgi:malate dehydrogenase (oxaloacetate-decarboxylating)